VGAGAVLRGRTGATHVLGLSDGYIGYLDTPDRVEGASGESHRQYFGAALLDTLGAGAQLASEAAGFSR
jgi:hypothetical protein